MATDWQQSHLRRAPWISKLRLLTRCLFSTKVARELAY